MKRIACLTLLGLPLLAAAEIPVVPQQIGTVPSAGNSVTRTIDPAPAVDPLDALATPPAIQPGTLLNGAVGTGATAPANDISTAGTAADTGTLAANGATTGTGTGTGIGTGTTPATGTPGLSSGGTVPGLTGNAATVAGDRISNAMSAAPPAVSANATIMEFSTGANAQPVTLRSGNNGWTCFPDNPATPGNDPICLDRQWMAWREGVLGRRAPVITGPGLAYRLQGGSEASTTDPFATSPAAGQTWMQLPPHILLLSPQRWDSTVFPSEMGINAGGPWVLFANTAWEQLIVPVPTTSGGAGAASGAATGLTPVQ